MIAATITGSLAAHPWVDRDGRGHAGLSLSATVIRVLAARPSRAGAGSSTPTTG